MIDYQLTSFSAGELTPRGRGRIDSPSYMAGCETLLNEIILPQGGATRRPGTTMITSVTSGSRLIEFEGKDGLGYVLVFNNASIAVYKDGVFVLNVTSPPWTLAQAWELQYAVDGNIMYIVHPDVSPRLLTYTPGTPTFILSAYAGASFPAAWDSPDLTSSDNYPSTITFYEGRALFGNSNNWPDHLWGSDVKDYDAFTESSPLVATNGFEVKINSEKGPQIKWMRGARGVFTGTSKGVFSVSDENNLLSPVTLITANQNSSYPASDIPGVFLSGEMFYIQKGERKVRLAAYDVNKDVYLTPDITTTAEHITEGLIKSIAVQTLPETLVWAILEDGTMLTYSLSQENQVSAWTRHSTEGLFKDICIVQEGSIEVVYVLVERNSTEYFEVFSPINFSNKEYMFLDSVVKEEFGSAISVTSFVWGSDIVVTATGHGFSGGEYVQVMGTDNEDLDYGVFEVEYVGANSFNLLDEVTGQGAVMDDFGTINTGTIQEARDTLTGLTHLNGEDVFVVSGPVPVGEYTVAGNQVTIPSKRTEITAGYNYYSDIVPMNIAAGKNKRKRIISLTIEVLNSLGGKAGKDAAHLDEFKYDKTIVMDVAQELISESIKIPHRGGNEFDGDILIRQDLPLPLTVLSLLVVLEVF